MLTVIGRRAVSQDEVPVDLKGVQIAQCHLASADLTKMNLPRADLLKADLRGAKNLTAAQLCRAYTLHDAQLDPDLRAEVEARCPDLLRGPSSRPADDDA